LDFDHQFEDIPVSDADLIEKFNLPDISSDRVIAVSDYGDEVDRKSVERFGFEFPIALVYAFGCIV
jgi:hypothetical protein